MTSVKPKNSPELARDGRHPRASFPPFDAACGVTQDILHRESSTVATCHAPLFTSWRASETGRSTSVLRPTCQNGPMNTEQVRLTALARGMESRDWSGSSHMTVSRPRSPAKRPSKSGIELGTYEKSKLSTRTGTISTTISQLADPASNTVWIPAFAGMTWNCVSRASYRQLRMR